MNTRKKNKYISANKKKSIKQQDGGTLLGLLGDAAYSTAAAAATAARRLNLLRPLRRAQRVLDDDEATADLTTLTDALSQETLNVEKLLQTVYNRLHKVDPEYPLTPPDIDYFNATLTGYEKKFITRLESHYNNTKIIENPDKKKVLLYVLNTLLMIFKTVETDDMVYEKVKKKVNEQDTEERDKRRNLIILCLNIIDTIMKHIETQNIDLKYQWIRISIAEKKNLINKVVKDKNYMGKLGIINKLVKVNPKFDDITNRHKRGSWYFEVWVPNIKWSNDWTGENGNVVKIVTGNKETTLSVLYDNKPVDTFITTNVYIYAIEFLPDYKYDPTRTHNYKPNVESENTHQIGEYVLRDNFVKAVIAPVRQPARLVSYMMSPRAIKGRFKVEINKILDKMEDDPKVRGEFKDILKRKIRYGNDLQTIKDILINKIASIFTDGESRFNPYNYSNLSRKKMESKFAEDKAEKEDRDTAIGIAGTETAGVVGELVRTGMSGGARETNIQQQGGIGSYGNRNVDLTEAKQFIIFILTSLIEIEKLSSNKDSDNVDLSLKTYLKTLFAKIGPSELNKLLPNIDSIKILSTQVIRHFKNNIDKDVDENTGKREAGERRETEGRGKTEASPEDEIEPAKVIAGLNFNLKHNVKSLITAIIDITLHYEDVKGSASVISNYLDNKYNMAMKKQSAEETRRIENNELKQALIYIFGGDSDKLDKYRTQINELDKVIDTMDEKNIDDVINQMMDKLNTSNAHVVVVGGGDERDTTIVYTLPSTLIVKRTEKAEIEKAEARTKQTNEELIATIKNMVGKFKEDSFDYEKIKELKETLEIDDKEDQLNKDDKIAKARRELRKLEADSKLELAYAKEEASRIRAELERRTEIETYNQSIEQSNADIENKELLKERAAAALQSQQPQQSRFAATLNPGRNPSQAPAFQATAFQGTAFQGAGFR